MSILKIGLPGGADFIQPSMTTTQFVIPAGAGATFAASGNIATIATNAAHGLTMAPAAGTMPNFFISFATAATGLAGTGALLGNVFQILSIPSTTTFTIWTTITAATVTATTFIPVFFPPFTAILGSTFVGFLNNLGTNVAGPLVQSSMVDFVLGANCTVQVDVTNQLRIQNSQLAATDALTYTMKTVLAASTAGQQWVNPPGMALWASGTTATSTASVIE
jgi:hypothetical protein